MEADLQLANGQPIVLNEKDQIPAGITDLLRMIGREVLRNQPQDIVVFTAEYLAKLVGVRDGKTESKSDLRALDTHLPESLQRKSRNQ